MDEDIELLIEPVDTVLINIAAPICGGCGTPFEVEDRFCITFKLYLPDETYVRLHDTAENECFIEFARGIANFLEQRGLLSLTTTIIQ